MVDRPRLQILTRTVLLAAALAVLGGCQLGYVVSQGWRQLALQRAQVPLDAESLHDSLSPSELEKLSWVPRVLEYCRDELHLEPGDAYTTFLDTGGQPISHIVVAAHHLALVPHRWHFPIAGDVPYKGYFERAEAQTEAARLRAEGLDVDVIAVGAYSTLGWFRDPVLSVTLELETADLVDLLIHETVHRTVYFEGETDANEALATHIATEGTLDFLARHPELAGQRAGYEERRAAEAELEEVLLRLRDHLDALYRSPRSPEQKLQLKFELFAAAERALRRLDPELPAGALPRSNARLLLISQYRDLVPGFARLQRRVGGRAADLTAYLKKFAASDQPVSVLGLERAGSGNVAAAPSATETSADETTR